MAASWKEAGAPEMRKGAPGPDPLALSLASELLNLNSAELSEAQRFADALGAAAARFMAQRRRDDRVMRSLANGLRKVVSA